MYRVRSLLVGAALASLAHSHSLPTPRPCFCRPTPSLRLS